MLLLLHRMGALWRDLSPCPPLWGIALTPSLPPLCQTLLTFPAQPPFLPRSSLQEPGLALGPVSLAVPRGFSPARGLSSPLPSPRREELALEGWPGLSGGSPGWGTGQGEEQAPCIARSRFHRPRGGIHLPASKATHGL